jgi:hypothetical protein
MYNLKFLYLFLLSSIILVLNLSCDKTKTASKDTTQDISTETFRVTAKDIDHLKYTEFALSNLSDHATKNWLKFQELQEEILILKKGDLSFFKDDKSIVESLITDLKKEIPEELNTPPILARLAVLESTTYKLQGVTQLNNVSKELLLKAIEEVLVANSNVILQMNKKFEKDAQGIAKPQ